MRRTLKAVLIDLSGTLINGTTPVPFCVDALRKLRAGGVPFRVCSNTSKESTASLLGRIHAMGFEIRDEEVFTSLGACRELVRRKNIKRPYLLLSDSALEEFPKIPDDVDAPYDAVVIGLAPERFTYHHLNTAFRILAHEHGAGANPRPRDTVPLIAMHKSRYLQEKDGLSMGPGGFVTALEYALGAQRAEVVGKPEEAFFRMVLESMQPDGIAEEDWTGVAIVGDDAETDLGGAAREMGLWRVLVKTGKYREGDEEKGLLPDEVYPSFAEFVDSLV